MNRTVAWLTIFGIVAIGPGCAVRERAETPDSGANLSEGGVNRWSDGANAEADAIDGGSSEKISPDAFIAGDLHVSIDGDDADTNSKSVEAGGSIDTAEGGAPIGPIDAPVGDGAPTDSVDAAGGDGASADRIDTPAEHVCRADFGASCGSCGGKIMCDGSCSQATPPNLGLACGSCGGVILCDGSCSHSTPQNLGLACGCGGKVLCGGTCSEPNDTCIPVGGLYALSNMFLGDNRRLDTYAGPPSQAFMSSGSDDAGQHWTITSLGQGAYRLTNMYYGDGLSLQSSIDGNTLFMGQNSDTLAQHWKITAAFGQYFFLTNMLFESRRLDSANTSAGDPWLAPIQDSSGQYWKITKLP